jgi:hypothetical protein
MILQGFLLHIFTLLAVERNNINGVFQITKGGFLTPAFMI